MTDRKLTPELLLAAYASGVFPMAETRDDPNVYWVDPQIRGVIPLDRFHVSRSLARKLRRDNYQIKMNSDLSAVLDGCADRSETWINNTIRTLVQILFQRGFAHTMEVWSEDRLIGGVYGIALGSAFFGESMFSREPDGSKIALTWLVDHLRRAEFKLFDTQFITPHLATLGAEEITRDQYRTRLAAALDSTARIDAFPLESDRQAVVQRMTQTS
ncbi:MAG: leucyl/phenylalanyl-tRNA--protein transferase [Boseongicola sp.]